MRTWGWGSVRPASLLSIPLLRVLLLSALLFNAGLGVGLPSAQAQEETLEEAPLEEGLEEALEEAEVIQLFPADDLLSDEVQDSSAPQGTQEEDAEETATRESFLPPTALAEEAIFDLPLASLSVLDETTGVLPLALWNSPPDRLNALFAQAQARTDSPASANLWRRILLSPFPLEATAPTGLLVPVTALDPGKTAQEATAEREAQETRVAEQAAAQETRSLGWFVWRTEQLQRLGRWRDLHRLFALVPRSRLLFAVAGGADNPQAETLAELARLRVETMILVGEPRSRLRRSNPLVAAKLWGSDKLQALGACHRNLGTTPVGRLPCRRRRSRHRPARLRPLARDRLCPSARKPRRHPRPRRLFCPCRRPPWLWQVARSSRFLGSQSVFGGRLARGGSARPLF